MITFHHIDVDDDARMREWHGVYWDSQIASRGRDSSAWVYEDISQLMRNQTNQFRHTGWTGYVDGEAVASLWMGHPLLDNLELVHISIDVAPAARRRGIGTESLRFLEGVTREMARSKIIAESDWPADMPESGAGAAGPEFLMARGYTLGLGELQRRLDLPVAEAVLARFEAEAAERTGDYRIESFIGPVPDEWVAEYAELDASVDTEAPTGDLDIEPHTPDVASVRVNDANEAATGRTRYGTYAFAPDGSLAAFSDLVTPAYEPGRAYQMGTIVSRGHRGHRLGMAVKVINLRFLQEHDPAINHILTWNAAANQHMIGVNEELGFYVSERAGQFLKTL
jgi:GNAT superfamily N-acetyltransferase